MSYVKLSVLRAHLGISNQESLLPKQVIVKYQIPVHTIPKKEKDKIVTVNILHKHMMITFCMIRKLCPSPYHTLGEELRRIDREEVRNIDLPSPMNWNSSTLLTEEAPKKYAYPTTDPSVKYFE